MTENDTQASLQLPKRTEPKFLKHLFKALPTLIGVSIITLILEHAGWLRSFETSTLDTLIQLKPPTKPSHVVIVEINEDDYKKLFEKTSPLDSDKLQELIGAIARGSPKVIGIDIDVSHIVDKKFSLQNEVTCTTHRKDIFQNWPCIIWAQDALTKVDGSVKPLSLFEKEKINPLSCIVLSPQEKINPHSGIVLLPQDRDGIVRRYRREFQTKEDKKVVKIDSFPWALVRAYSSASSDRACDDKKSFINSSENHKGDLEEDLILNFSGERYAFPHYTAESILEGSTGSAWPKGILNNKIVLLGGAFRAARDEYITPVGPRLGVEIIAQAVESDLQDGGIRPANEILMLILEILGGVSLVFLHYRLKSKVGLALILSLFAIPIAALIFSYIAFSSLALWANFIPILVAILIHELHHHAVEYKRLYNKELEGKQAQE